MLSALERLMEQAAEWSVTISETRETETSLLGFGECNGARVVLKVSKHEGDEWHSGNVLEAFRGDATVRVYQSDAGAVLLERLDPATELAPLVRGGRDEDATLILAQVISAMRNHEPPAHCPTVFDWARGFDRYIRLAGERGVPLALAKEAAQLYLSLAASQKRTMLLHGDLHHYNVLFDTNRGWVAIDPKGVVGELEYELGAIIRNPIEVPDLFLSRSIIERRLHSLTTALKLDYQRSLGWSFAQAVLSAIWDIEDGLEMHSEHSSLRLAQVIREMRQEI